MVLLFWVVLILFSIVKTKIVHYSSLCYFPLSFLSAYGINKLLTGESKWNSRLKFLGIVISLFLGLAFSLIPLIDNLKEIFISSSMIKDSFTIACLSENVGWKWYDASPGIIFLFSSSFFILGYKRIKFNQVIVFFVLNALCLYFILLFIVPKIERYSQGPEIDFFKNLKDKKCYTETVGFKSFAPLFYAEKTPELNTPELIEHVKNKIESDKRTGQPIFSFNLYATNFIRGEEIRFPAYFSVRFNDSENFEKENPHIKKL